MRYLELARSANRSADATGQTTILRPEALAQQARGRVQPAERATPLRPVARQRAPRRSYRRQWERATERLRDWVDGTVVPLAGKAWLWVRLYGGDAAIAIGVTAVGLLTAYIVFVQH